MKSSEIRTKFLNFFNKHGHSIVPSSSLVPTDDPTLMFTNAGMNQFKDCFLGAEKRSYTRAVTCQKVMRIAGKHNDFENVGVTARHHTFFEMLGNFSFGDYFKADAIRYGWDFVTNELGLSADRLWVTVYEKDDEAAKLWREITGISSERIVRLGEQDNFWAMGETGPCGPCTEMHVFGGDNPKLETAENLAKGTGGFLEIWNLVFMQFNRSASGELKPLPKPSVDTGMGLERVTSIMQGVRSNYDTDLLRGIIKVCEDLSGFTYRGDRYETPDLHSDPELARDVAMRVIADHSRAMAFIIADGVVPGSEGRSYILRRIIRRAIRHGRVLKFSQPFLTRTTKEVISSMGEIYPELRGRADHVARVVDAEERKFQETLEAGMSILQREAEQLSKGKPFSGVTAFLLHDTYGFPLDLTQDALKSFGAQVNNEEFEREMEKQRTRSREDRKSQKISFQAVQIDAPETRFTGYQESTTESTLAQILPSADKETISLLFKETPFYAESGGQVGDTGEIKFADVSLKVLDTQKLKDKYYVHECRVDAGTFSPTLVGKKAVLSIDAERRTRIRANHSSTHLVHAALREVLGTHVKQAGSKVDDNGFRFDYSHFENVTESQLADIQNIVHQQIRENHEVHTRVLPVEEAIKSGAMALFGEKYGAEVRVVDIGPRSLELCGGTHVARSGDIGVMLISHEGGIAAGTRRIECLSGAGASAALLRQRHEMNRLAELLKSDHDGVPDKVEKLIHRMKALEQEVSDLQSKFASAAADDIAKNVRSTPSGVRVICQTVQVADVDTLRSLVDRLRTNLGSGVVALGTTLGEKGMIIAGVTSDLTSRVDAGKLIKEVTKISGGKGGGRADFAQAGGLDPSALQKSLEKVLELIG